MTIITKFGTTTTGTTGWTTAGNALAQDGVFAKSTLTSGNATGSGILKVQGYGFDIPLDATINSISVNLTGKNGSATGFNIVYNQLTLRNFDTLITDTVGKNSGTSWTGTAASTKTIGGDLWGAGSISADVVNDAGFGIWVYMHNVASVSQYFYMDSASISIDFTEAAPAEPSTGHGKPPQ